MLPQVYTELDQDPVPHALLRKYIAYARTHVHPVLSGEAKQVGRTLPAGLFQQRCTIPSAEQLAPKEALRGACAKAYRLEVHETTLTLPLQ